MNSPRVFDYPFTSVLHKRTDGSLNEEEEVMLQEMRDTLESFFTVIKSLIETQLVKFAFVTRITRLFSNCLPDSEPYNLLTLKDKYSTIRTW